MVRRTVQQLERGEVSVRLAISLIECGPSYCHPEARYVAPRVSLGNPINNQAKILRPAPLIRKWEK